MTPEQLWCLQGLGAMPTAGHPAPWTSALTPPCRAHQDPPLPWGPLAVALQKPLGSSKYLGWEPAQQRWLRWSGCDLGSRTWKGCPRDTNAQPSRGGLF